MSGRPKSKLIKIDDLLKRDAHNHFLYINYDNEAYMNTGIQESGATPSFASTTTGPGGKLIKGKIGIKQDIESVKKILRKNLKEVFDLEWIN